MRHRRVVALFGIAAGFWGCGEVTGLPSAEPVAIVQGLLIPGEPRHLLQAEWSSPTSVPYAPPPRPVDASLVDLWLIDPAGDSARYFPTGLPGQFAATAPVRSGERYRLSGTVTDRAVAAQVSVPGALVVSQPAGDTLRRPLDVFSPIQFEWRAAAAASYQALLMDADGTMRRVFVRGVSDTTGRVFPTTGDTTGELLIEPPSPARPDTVRLLIFGYDPSATAFFSSTTKGNVQGVFGLFGAATRAEKVVVWE